MRTLLVAVQLLTRVPVRLRVQPSDGERARAAAWFPAVGAGVGGVAALAYALFARTRAPGLAPWAALAAAVALTGAFHEDGLADACDGLFGGHDRARRLAIMRDSRLGTFGVVGLMLTLGVQVSALSALRPELACWTLVAAHALGRAAALPLTLMPYARGDADGVGRPFARAVPGAALGVALASGVAALALLPWPAALASLGAATLIALVCAYRFARDLGGITGDTLGATVKLVEVSCYVATAVSS
jgi:adenosylcobinamide-GDP ribazoletransferase